MSEIKDIYLKELAVIKSRNKWALIAAGVIVVLAIILLITVFKKHDAVSTDYLNKIQQLDSTIKYQQKYIDALQADQAQRDSVIIDKLQAIKDNRPTQTKIIHEYDQVPNNVRSLDKSGLRREITNY